jgi:membrane-associated phospholipid phosphatase
MTGSRSEQRSPGRPLRTALVLVVVFLHFSVYRVVNLLNQRRPASAFFDFAMPADSRIPYLGWTWVIYWAALPYMLVLGLLVFQRLPARSVLRAAAAYATMIAVAATVQLLFPGRSPWPADMSPVQRFFHESVSYDPFVCLPSMHVALVTLTACLGSAVFRSRRARAAQFAVVVLVCLSTLTLKEHYIWDVVAGGVLATGVFFVWRHSLPRITPEVRARGLTSKGDAA